MFRMETWRVAIDALQSNKLGAFLTVPVPRISVVLAIGPSWLTVLLFGCLTANKAAKLQPTDSLRYE